MLKNIEDTPSDLLSFLLPLVEGNQLQVTSSFTIVPKLGFRIFCLAKEGLVVGKQEDIKPLLSVLHQTDLLSLYQINTARDDFEQIIQAKFPALFMPLVTTQTIHSLLQSGIKFINQAM